MFHSKKLQLFAFVLSKHFTAATGSFIGVYPVPQSLIGDAKLINDLTNRASYDSDQFNRLARELVRVATTFQHARIL